MMFLQSVSKLYSTLQSMMLFIFKNLISIERKRQTLQSHYHSIRQALAKLCLHLSILKQHILRRFSVKSQHPLKASSQKKYLFINSYTQLRNWKGPLNATNMHRSLQHKTITIDFIPYLFKTFPQSSLLTMFGNRVKSLFTGVWSQFNYRSIVLFFQYLYSPQNQLFALDGIRSVVLITNCYF